MEGRGFNQAKPTLTANLGKVLFQEGKSGRETETKGPHRGMRPMVNLFSSYFGGSGFVAVPAGFVEGLEAAPVGLLLAPAGFVGAATPDWAL